MNPVPNPTRFGLASGGRSPWLRFVLPLVAISLLIGIIGAVAYRYLSEEIRRETHRTLAVIAEQKRQQIENSLADIRIDAESYFSADSRFELLFGEWLSGGRQDGTTAETMKAHLNTVAQRRGWGGVVVFDTDAKPVISLGETDLDSHAQLIGDILARPRSELVDLHLNARMQGQYGIVAPVGATDAPLGAVYLTWRADQVLNPLVESWPVPTRTAETYLVRRDDQGVRFLTPLRHRQDAALTLTQALSAPDLPAARAVQGELGILAGGRDYRGVPVLAYAAAVAGTPWLMLAEIDEREAYAGIRTVAWATALVMGLGLLLIYSAGYLLWRREQQRQELAALQAQRAAEARFRVIFERAPLGVALVDSHSGRFNEVNLRFAEIVGRSPAGLVGLDPASITHPDDAAESLEQLRRLRANEISGYNLNKRYLRPDGAIVWASLTCAPVQVESEESPRYLFIVEDITARRQMEESLVQASAEAEAANAAKSEFLAHMSHEIRTPMNAVLGLAQVLEREPLASNQRDMVERIRGAGQSLLSILNDVLDLSKIEAGQLRIEPRPFDLGVLLANLDSLMGQAARAKGLSLHIEAPSVPPEPLLGDGLRVEQVLFNLAGNAIKFTETGAVTIVVEARETGPQAVQLRFEVRDSGIGIEPESLPNLFAPFVQADAGIARRFGGTGLGLSICKRLVELMGGVIGVQSQFGQGSTFWFELPLQRVSADEVRALALKPASRPCVPGLRLDGAHLLVVDDSAMNRDLVERALRLEGATATLAADGQQALQLLTTRAEGFDAVLMDVRMPVMDGLAAMRVIRADLGLIDLPIIAFTAGVRDDQQAAARAAGANDVLAKPMDLEEMAVMLATWVKPRANRPHASTVAPGSESAKGLARESVEEPVEEPVEGVVEHPSTGLFPEIPGIDRERAEQRLGKDCSMFVSLLQMFVEDNGNAIALAREDLAAGNKASAARRMHTLASNAGFLCALELMRAARALELAMDGGQTDLESPLAAIEQQIAELIAASAPWR